MSIDPIRYTRKDGTKVERFRVRKTTLGKHGPTWGIYDDRAEAERQNAICNAMADKVASYTLKELGEEFYPVNVPAHKYRWKNHILKDPIASLELAAITKDDCRAWFKRQLATDQKASVISITAGVFRYAFKVAIAEDKCIKNYIDIIFPEIKTALFQRQAAEEARGEMTAGDQLSYDELMSVASCQAIPEHARLRIMIFALQGWRRGEFSSLKLVDLHLDAVPPYADIKTGGLNKPRKSRKPYRSFILPECLPYLRRWLELLPSYCLVNKLQLVFPAVEGGYHWQPFQMSKRVASPGSKVKDRCVGKNMLPVWLRLAGITRPFRPHDLRHTGGSLLARTAPLAVVQKHLGHASIHSTMRYVGASMDEYAKTIWASEVPKADPTPPASV